MGPSAINRIVSGAARRLACLPFKCLPSSLRADVVERLSEEMITSTQVRGVALRFFAPSRLLQQRAASVLVKEPDMMLWLDGLGADAVLWDVGANVGVFSLYAALRTDCRVLAFEPSAANFDVLTRNIELNTLEKRITAYCIALSGTTELGVLNLSSMASGSAMSQFGRLGEMSRYWNGASAGMHGMVGFAMDEFIDRFQPLFPTHIKLDVDGLEVPILHGATKTLQDLRLRAVMVELSVTDRDEGMLAIKLMQDAGFELIAKGHIQSCNAECAANHLFERVR